MTGAQRAVHAPIGTAGRAVVLVGNPAAPYSRALRIARALVDSGFSVEIAAVAGEGLPDAEMDGEVRIRRYAPSGRYASMAATYRSPALTPTGDSKRPRLFGRIARRGAAVRRWLFWPHTVRGWWATLARELEPADLYHACGSLTVAAALAARRRDQRTGRHSRVIYDGIDDVVASNNVLGMPPVVRWLVEQRERHWARASDARITVNDALAVRLHQRWRTVRPPLVVPNWPAPSVEQPGGGSRPDLIRERLGLPDSTRIVLFEGRLGPNLGLDEAAEAVLRVPQAALVLIGFGRWTERCRARDRDPRFAGRHFTLPAVHPDEVLTWTASADVCLVPLPPVSENQRAATPNKFWEAITAGIPLVIGHDLPVMADIVERHELGVVARSLGPADLASAIESVLSVEPSEAASRRKRISGVAQEHFSWPRAAARYRELVGSLLS